MHFQHSYMVFGGQGVGYYSQIDILPSVANYTGFAPKPVQTLSIILGNQLKSMSKFFSGEGKIVRFYISRHSEILIFGKKQTSRHQFFYALK